MQVGLTYLADRLSKENETIQSALNHVYISEEIVKCSSVRKMDNTSTDHKPIVTETWMPTKPKVEPKVIRKRSMKNFTNEK